MQPIYQHKSYFWVVCDHAMLANVNAVFETKLVGDASLGALTQTHGFSKLL